MNISGYMYITCIENLTSSIWWACIYITEQCTLPAALRGDWISSEKDDLVFADSSFSGFKVHIYNTDNFTCIDSSGSNYLFKYVSYFN